MNLLAPRELPRGDREYRNPHGGLFQTIPDQLFVAERRLLVARDEIPGENPTQFQQSPGGTTELPASHPSSLRDSTHNTMTPQPGVPPLATGTRRSATKSATDHLPRPQVSPSTLRPKLRFGTESPRNSVSQAVTHEGIELLSADCSRNGVSQKCVPKPEFGNEVAFPNRRLGTRFKRNGACPSFLPFKRVKFHFADVTQEGVVQ